MILFVKLVRLLLIAVLNAVGLLLLEHLSPGIIIDNFYTALLVAIIFGLVNAAIWPLFIRFALPLTVFTFGLAGIFFNMLVVFFADSLLSGFMITNTASYLTVVIGITVINIILSQIFHFDDEESYYSTVVKRLAKKYSKPTENKKPGFLFIQIDGLAFKVLYHAIQAGNVPNISNMIRSGEFRLEKWQTDWSSQTGASQAGLLMGSNENIPAFRWYEKDSGKMMSVGRPQSIGEIEKRLSNGRGLLSRDGASRGNLFSGDAKYTLLTLSAIGKKNRKGFGHEYYSYFSNPQNIIRTVIMMVVDIGSEIKSTISQNRHNVWPRKTELKITYPLLRAWTTVVQRDILFQTVIADMYEGRSAIYADFVGYDEVSHHTGPERHETLGILRDIDRQIGRLNKIMQDTPRKYNLVLVSDHGQTQGATFKQRCGYTLDELVNSLCGENVEADLVNNEAKNFLSAATLEVSQSGGLIGRSVKNVNRLKSNSKNMTSEKEKKIKVLASGSLGLIYFTQFKHRLTMEEINKEYPKLISGLLSNPFIGFLLVKSANGSLVIGKKGKIFLKTGKVEGENPLKFYPPETVEKIKRTDGFNNVADIMVNSFYDPVMDEVAAFEELIGSHGGLGGEQSYPFVLFPAKLKYPIEPILGAGNLHKVMKNWM